MQQRRPRLGDILDDYCPRERRVTNHVIVAMIDDEVKQTRCSTCDADHDYKQARVPPRRKKPESSADGEPVETTLRSRTDDAGSPAEPFDVDAAPAASSLQAAADSADGDAADESATAAPDDDGPVHRRLIRATLPRPDGQMPERKEPDFTMRQPGFRDGQKNGRRGRRSPMRGPGGGSQPTRFGSPRGGFDQGPRHGGGGPGYRALGNRQGGQPGGARGQRGPGGPSGPGGAGGGRKRGR